MARQWKTGLLLTFVLPVLSLAVLPGPAGADPLIKEQRGLFGLYDEDSSNFTVEPLYDSLRLLNKDRYKAVLRGRCGVIDGSGGIVVDFKYENLYMTGRHYIVRVKFDSTVFRGTSRVTTRYHTVMYKYGLLDDKGAVVIPVTHDILQPLSLPSLFRFWVFDRWEETRPNTLIGAGRYGIINLNNDVVVPAEYESIEVVKEKSGKTQVTVMLKKKGAEPEFLGIPVKEEPADVVGAPTAVERKPAVAKEKPAVAVEKPAAAGPEEEKERKIVRYKAGNDRYGFKTTDGKVVLRPAFEDAWDFKEGCARVKKDGKWGFISESGTVIVAPQYDYVWDFDNGRAKVRMDDGGIRHIDRNGRLLDE
jgi:hypothetical protein